MTAPRIRRRKAEIIISSRTANARPRLGSHRYSRPRPPPRGCSPCSSRSPSTSISRIGPCSPFSSSRSRSRAGWSWRRASTALSGRWSAQPSRCFSSPSAPRSACSSSAVSPSGSAFAPLAPNTPGTGPLIVFVLSGYTVAIVGIPGALDAGNAFLHRHGARHRDQLGHHRGCDRQPRRPAELAGSLVLASGRRRSRGARRLRRRALRRRRHRAVAGETVGPGDRNREFARFGDLRGSRDPRPEQLPSGSSTRR